MRLASAVEPEWLLDLFPHRLREVSTLEWNRSGERVEAVTSLMFDQIAIETRRTPPDPEQAGIFLAHKAVEAGLARFADLDEIEAFQSRVRFASEHSPVTPLDAAAVESALASLATGLKSFAELESASRGGGLLRAIERQMPPPARRLLDEIAPSSIRLPRGRQVPVHYEPNQPPWIASRLQDFFGMRETPTVGRGAVRCRGAPAGAESAPGANDHRSGRLLAAAVPASAQGTRAPLSQARLAGEPLGVNNSGINYLFRTLMTHTCARTQVGRARRETPQAPVVAFTRPLPRRNRPPRVHLLGNLAAASMVPPRKTGTAPNPNCSAAASSCESPNLRKFFFAHFAALRETCFFSASAGAAANP